MPIRSQSNSEIAGEPAGRSWRYLLAVLMGRLYLLASLVALACAWASEASGQSMIGLSQQYLFFNSFALALLGIGSLLDALVHTKGR